jgi:hypothetical protein
MVNVWGDVWDVRAGQTPVSGTFCQRKRVVQSAGSQKRLFNEHDRDRRDTRQGNRDGEGMGLQATSQENRSFSVMEDLRQMEIF